MMDHRWNVVKERDGFWSIVNPLVGKKRFKGRGSVQLIIIEGDSEKGVAKYLVSAHKFGLSQQALATLTYCRTGDNQTSVQGTLDVEATGLVGLTALLLDVERKAAREADELIDRGDRACQMITKGAPELSRLSKEQFQTVVTYREKWKPRRIQNRVHERAFMTKLLMQSSRDGFAIVYERSDLPNPVGPFHKRLNRRLLSHFAKNLQGRITYDLSLHDSLANRSIHRELMLESEGPPPNLEELGKGLFASLIPKDIGADLRSHDGYLVISTDDSKIPWELLHDGRDFLCRQYSMGRTIIRPFFPQRHLVPATMPAKLKMLILADPLENVTGKALPEAREEAEEIARNVETSEMADKIEVDIVTGKKVTPETVARLLAQAYDIVHYSGHAGYLKEHKEAFLLLNNGSGGTIPMSANEIYNLLGGSPVVFVNACETGIEDQEIHVSEFMVTPRIEGLASAFTSAGARAYVGTLWPVFDDLARKIAIAFYRRLCSGTSVGTALQLARLEGTKTTDLVTWAAYVLFGQPDSTISFS